MVSVGLFVAVLVWSLTFSSCFAQRIAWLVPGPNSTNLINSDRSIAALKLALASVSRTSLTPGGKNISIKFFETECRTKEAMIAMIKQRPYSPDMILGPPCEEGMKTVAKVASFFNVPVFSWFNPSTEFDDSKKYSTLIRMFPSVGIMSKALFHIMNENGWKQFALLHDTDSLGRILKHDLQREVVGREGFRIMSTSRISNTMTDTNLVKRFNNIKKQATIIVLACSGNTVRRYMLAAEKAEMTNGQHVFIQLDYKIYTAEELRRGVLSDKAWRRGDSKDQTARKAFESLIHVILDPTYDLNPMFTRVTPKSTYGEFSRLALADANITRPGWELPEVRSLSDVKPCVSSMFLYDSLLVWSVLTEVMRQTGMDPRRGRAMARIAKNFNSEGTTGFITFNPNLGRLGKVFVLDMNHRGRFKPVQVLKENKATTFDVINLAPADTMFTWSVGRRGILFRPQDVPQITKQYTTTKPTTTTSTTTPTLTTSQTQPTTTLTTTTTGPTTTTPTTTTTTTTTSTTTKPTTTTLLPTTTTTTTTTKPTTTPKPTTTSTTTTTKPTTTPTTTTEKTTDEPTTITSSTRSHIYSRMDRKTAQEENNGSTSVGRRKTLNDLESFLANLIKLKWPQTPSGIFHRENREEIESLNMSRSSNRLGEKHTTPLNKKKTLVASSDNSGSKAKQRVSNSKVINRLKPISNRDQQEQMLQRRSNFQSHVVRNTDIVLLQNSREKTMEKSHSVPKASNTDVKLIQASPRTTPDKTQTVASTRNIDMVDNTRGTRRQTGNIYPVSKSENSAVRKTVSEPFVNAIRFPNSLRWNFDTSPIDTTMVYPKSLFPSDLLDPSPSASLSEYTPPVDNPYTLVSKIADNFNAIPKQRFKTRERVEKIPYASILRERIKSIVPINSRANSKDVVIAPKIPITTTDKAETTTKMTTTVKPTTTTTTTTTSTTTTRKPTTEKPRKKSTIPKAPSAVELIMARLLKLEAYIKRTMRTTSPKPPVVTTEIRYTDKVGQAPIEVPVTREYKSDPSKAIIERLLAIESSIKSSNHRQKPYLNTENHVTVPTILSKQVKERKRRPNQRIKVLSLQKRKQQKAGRVSQTIDKRKINKSNTQNGVIWGSRIRSKWQDGPRVEEDTSDSRARRRQTSKNAIKQSQLVIQTVPTTMPTPTTTVVVTTSLYNDVNNAKTVNNIMPEGRRQQIVHVNQNNLMLPLKTLKSNGKSSMKTWNNPAQVGDNRNIIKESRHASYITGQKQILNSKIQAMKEQNSNMAAEMAPPTSAGIQTATSVNQTIIEKLSAKVAESVTNQITKEVISASLGTHNESKYAIHIVSDWIPSNVEEGLPKLKMTFHVNKTKLSNKSADVNTGGNKSNIVIPNIKQTTTFNESNQIQSVNSQKITDMHIEEDGNQSSPDKKSKPKGSGLRISLGPLLSSMGFKLPQRPMSRMNGMRPPGRMPSMPPPGAMPPMQQMLNMRQMPPMAQMPNMPSQKMPPMPNMRSPRGIPQMPMMHPGYAMMPPSGGGGGEAEDGQQQPSYGPPPMYRQPPPMYQQPMPQRPPMYPPNARYGHPPPYPMQAHGGRGFSAYPMPPMYGGRPMWPGSQRRRSRVAD